MTDFRSALQCLTKLGEDLDFSCAPDRLSVSTVNSSRTAFGIVHFYPRFFTRYDIADQDGNGTGPSRRRRSHTSGASQTQAKFRFSVTGKVRSSLSLPLYSPRTSAHSPRIHTGAPLYSQASFGEHGRVMHPVRPRLRGSADAPRTGRRLGRVSHHRLSALPAWYAVRVETARADELLTGRSNPFRLQASARSIA